MKKGSARPLSCTNPVNRTGMTTITYSGDITTITDPAGKVKEERTDALGRLASVVEDPNGLCIGASYEYDALDNLRTVTQLYQVRTFTYSSLGRLLTATMPEPASWLAPKNLASHSPFYTTREYALRLTQMRSFINRADT